LRAAIRQHCMSAAWSWWSSSSDLPKGPTIHKRSRSWRLVRGRQKKLPRSMPSGSLCSHEPPVYSRQDILECRLGQRWAHCHHNSRSWPNLETRTCLSGATWPKMPKKGNRSCIPCSCWLTECCSKSAAEPAEKNRIHESGHRFRRKRRRRCSPRRRRNLPAGWLGLREHRRCCSQGLSRGCAIR
jgi:hypothetical protein